MISPDRMNAILNEMRFLGGQLEYTRVRYDEEYTKDLESRVAKLKKEVSLGMSEK